MIYPLLLLRSTLWISIGALASNLQQRAAPTYNADLDDGADGTYPVQTFATTGDLPVPRFNFPRWDARCDDGNLVMITPRGHQNPVPGPMIVDPRGELVWTQHFDNEYGGEAYDLMMQTYKGQDYLTFWLGDDRVRGHGSGSYYMLDSSYEIVHQVSAANGLDADLHEFLITPDDTALLTVYEIIECQPGDGQAPFYLWDGIFQEVTIDTQELLFQWRASDHILIDDSYVPVEGAESADEAHDFFHINSVSKDEYGNYLISARYFHSIYYIDGVTGDIIWTIGGKKNNFLDLSDGQAINFAYQHNARFHSLDSFPESYQPPAPIPGMRRILMSLFDNAAGDMRYDYGLPFSRGLLLELTYPTPGEKRSRRAAPSTRGEQGEELDTQAELDMRPEVDLQAEKIWSINGTSADFTVRLIHSYENPQRLRASSQGSMQILPQAPGKDPKVLIGYGLDAAWTEFAGDETVLCDVHFGAKTSFEAGDIQSYRAYKQPWVGWPKNPPTLVLSSDMDEVYVSWNGATEVNEWILQFSDELDSEDDDVWDEYPGVKKTAFETTIALDEDAHEARYLRVLALDSNGNHIPYGISEIVGTNITATMFVNAFPYLPFKRKGVRPEAYLLGVTSIFGGLILALHLYRRLGGRGNPLRLGAVAWKRSIPYMRLH